MSTRNHVPRAANEGSLGTSAKPWGGAHLQTAHVGGREIGADLNAARNAAAPRQGVRIGPSLSDRVTFEPHKLGGGAMTLIWSSANLPTDSTRALIHYQTRTGSTDFSDGINIFQPGGTPAKLDVVLRQQESANAYYRIQSVDNIFDGKWKRLAVVIDNSGADPDIKLYVNGVLSGVSVTTAKTGTFDDSAVNNAVISLAGGGTAHHTQGDIILYNFALTSTQIGDRYASGVWVPAEEQGSTGDRAVLNLTPQGLGRQLLDVSANRNHALCTPQPSYTQPANSCIHKVTVANATGNATNTDLAGGAIQPANTQIRAIRYRRTSGSGAFQIGTASAGSQIVASTSGASGSAALLTLRDTATAAAIFVNMAASTTYEFTFEFEKL